LSAAYFYTDTACMQGQSEGFPADYECYDVSSYQSFQILSSVRKFKERGRDAEERRVMSVERF
jgi:hypothetical protein